MAPTSILLGLSAALVGLVWLAAVLGRALKLRHEPPRAPMPGEDLWLRELAILELERRHPVC